MAISSQAVSNSSSRVTEMIVTGKAHWNLMERTRTISHEVMTKYREIVQALTGTLTCKYPILCTPPNTVPETKG